MAADTHPVRETVMAEQVSHNVVNELSAAAHPPVDVAAILSTADSASGGDKPASTASNSLNSSTSVNELASTAKVSIPDAKPELRKDAVEPSAGDAVFKPAQASAEPPAPSVNGDLANGNHENAALGDGVPDDRSTADLSINSDTDNSRVESGDKKDGNHHVRANSVKKPTTFSKVTTTKSFMAKAATPTPSTPKMGDKRTQPSVIAKRNPVDHFAAAPTVNTVVPTAKPRLVAKSAGPSLRDIQKARAEGPHGPDASKVWNKNRPVAPPPPRQFTDEELKQQYGIHLATRLQTDESGKESKWADIDDEEDDWVPEQVVWMDGTKSTLAPQEMAPPPKEELSLPSHLGKPTETVKPVLANMKKPELTTRTILKPGVAILTPNKNIGPSTASPGPDKASLKAKAPATGPPTKSPWAPVPKVDTVSPINPPVQLQSAPPPMAPQDARAYEPQNSVLPIPAREIAADTFDRSWREGEGAPRELFNSANGRYEPAPEGRRLGPRSDGAHRKPSVLQRPSNGAIVPAEPSPAFQTRSSSQMDGSWGRRRGSSVSQGSISAHRRMSLSKGSEFSEAPERRTSFVREQDMHTTAQPAKPNFQQQSAWDQQMPPRPLQDAEPAAPVETQAEAQIRIMREKRELAKQRREEEEAREKAAKEERLKLKLASLEGHGVSRSAREAEAAAAAVKISTAAGSSTEQTQTNSQAQPAKPAETSAAAASMLEAQQLPPAPTHSLHEPAKLDDSLALPSPIPSKYQSPGADKPESSSKRVPSAPHSPRAATRAPYQQSSTYRGSASSYSSPGERKIQPFVRSPAVDNNNNNNSNNNNNAFNPWGPTAATRSVWGTSGIGNGTFESSLAPLTMTQPAMSLPPPPGMGRPVTSSRISPQNFSQTPRSPSLQRQQPVEQQRAFAAPSMDSQPDSFSGQSRLNGVSPAPGAGRPVHPPGPIAPPSRSQLQQAGQKPAGVSAWQNAAQQLPAQYAAGLQATAQGMKEEESEPEEYVPTFNHTFKKTASVQGKLGGPRKYEKTEYIVHDAQGTRVVSSHEPAPPNAQTQPSGPFSTASPQSKSSTESNVRIPNGSQIAATPVPQNQQPPIAPPRSQQPTPYQSTIRFPTSPLPPAGDSKLQSPPPPETESHPVFTGSSNPPMVRLPPQKPTVKLPPSSTLTSNNLPQASMQPGFVMVPPRPAPHWMPPGASRPIAESSDWQARFNGLFHRTNVQTEIPPSPPKTPPKMHGPALAVASSSKAPMDYQNASILGNATVSLPQVPRKLTIDGFIVDGSSDTISKSMIEQIFNDELAFGSQPQVRVPSNANYPPPFDATRRFENSRFQMRTVEPQTVKELSDSLIYIAKDAYYLRIPKTKLQNKRVYFKPRKDRNGDASQGFKDRKVFAKHSKSPLTNKDGAAPAVPSATTNITNESAKKSAPQKKEPAPSNASAAVRDAGAGSSAATPPGENKRKWNKPKPSRSRTTTPGVSS